MTTSCFQSCRANATPSWLQVTLADLEDKMQSLASTLPEEDDSDSFAERAENYYQKRPQLLTLVQDLYNKYLSLADRYSQNFKNHQSQQISTVHSELDDDNPICHPGLDSDAESCLSYQPPPQIHPKTSPESDAVIAELVTKAVDNDILSNEIEVLGRRQIESSKKIELQKSLLEVLESERLILLSENARLGFRVSAVAEENKGLKSEAVFMKRKASELAMCVLKMREDHRVCLLSRKIEDLQGQIYGLEKLNKEYYEEIVRREKERRDFKFGIEKLKGENERLMEEVKRARDVATWISSWWDRVKKFDFMCGSQTKGR